MTFSFRPVPGFAETFTRLPAGAPLQVRRLRVAAFATASLAGAA